MIPDTEFRTRSISSTEPIDRTSEGTVIGTGQTLDLSSVDTTDESQDIPVHVVWWRVSDMKGNSEISNIRVWLDGTDEFTGTVSWYMDITDSWTSGKTAVKTQTGIPGTAPTSEGAANITKNGGGTITGIVHSQTTQYIYITGSIGVDEPTGVKSGLTLKVAFDYH